MASSPPVSCRRLWDGSCTCFSLSRSQKVREGLRAEGTQTLSTGREEVWTVATSWPEGWGSGIGNQGAALFSVHGRSQCTGSERLAIWMTLAAPPTPGAVVRLEACLTLLPAGRPRASLAGGVSEGRRGQVHFFPLSLRSVACGASWSRKPGALHL